MKNRNKKVIALLLVGAMTMGLGVSVSASEKISEEGVTLTVAGNKPSGLEDWTNLACIQEYKDRLGINLEWILQRRTGQPREHFCLQEMNCRI